jgi:hypothetical protein
MRSADIKPAKMEAAYRLLEQGQMTVAVTASVAIEIV